MDANTADDKYSGVVEVTLHASRWVAAACAGAGMATIGLLGLLPLRLDLAIALATLVACLALDAMRRVLARHRLLLDLSSIVVDGVAGTLRPGSFVAPWLTIVRWRPAAARFDRTLLVSPDRFAPAAFRHLRVIVKNSPN